MTFQFHTCCQSNALKNKTLHFSQVSTLLSRSLAYFHVSHVLLASLSLPLCLHSLSVCLSFTLSSCRVHTVLCVLFLNEDFFSSRQPLSSAVARPQLANLWSCSYVEKSLSWHLKERITEKKIIGEN